MTGTARPAPSARERNMRRILLVFALICFALAGELYWEMGQLRERLATLTSPGRAVEQDPYPVRRSLKRTRILVLASAGGGVLLLISAVAVGWKKGGSAPPGGSDA